ncbi:branched-chain-amino-acid transaminase [Thioalkalivibrio sp. HK1]|uniref:branched-chain-amino-acid transaminase n=1 Tax=Thioalkalivibrio sp. HK1 TaxID=1469245 RepID=UPI0004BA11C8|nr:branched-chain-amino-acid transaminase [Thioalkalivibrio sp. HK1]
MTGVISFINTTFTEQIGFHPMPSPSSSLDSSPPARFIYLDDRILPWEDARVHVASVGFKFGAGVFEGVRGYWNPDKKGLFLLQLEEHLERLEFSQRFMRFDEILPAPFVAEKVLELLRANAFEENIHIMITVFVKGYGSPATTGPIGLSIVASPRKDIPWTKTGCTAHISSWQRVPDSAMPMRVKCNANYQNGRLATMQAQADGYDTAILLNARGKVAEGPGMCMFMVRNGKAITPPITSDILESITRSTVIRLCEGLGIEVVEREIDRSELVAADEAFFCGTAWEITPLISVDRLAIGSGEVGPVVRRLQERFFSITGARSEDAMEWLTGV